MSGEKSTFECVVSADLFRRALMGISTEETRYYLNGVHVAAAPEGGAVLAATNGSFLIAIRDRDAHVKGSGIVQLTKAMVAALKTPRGLTGSRLLAIKGSQTKAPDQRGFVVDVEGDKDVPYAVARKILDAPDYRVQSAQHGHVLIDGTFPNWRQVIPDTADLTAPIQPLDLIYLARIGEALSASKHTRQVHLTSCGPNAPVLVTTAESRVIDGFAILMPIRTNTSPGAVPVWAKAPKKEPVAKAA